MSQSLATPATLVEHAIRACGGGHVFCLGPRADVLADEFRRRAVEATAGTAETWDEAVVHLQVHDDRTFDLVVVEHVVDTLESPERHAAIDELLRVSRSTVLLRASGRSRVDWERDVLVHHCRKHPLHQTLVPYQGLDWEGGTTTLLVERLPDDLTVGASLSDLAAERDLHMDMLREGGRRADAHVARYMFARQFIRPGDRVLDAACGLGYGSAILTDGTLAESVEGIDIDTAAVDYAACHYGRTRSRLSFVTCDLTELASRPAGCLDAIVSFETLEHIANPDEFLETCHRLLTPGGRLICSVPNEWLNEDGVDPNPHHLQVFNRERLERTCGRHFLVEHTYAQTAGGGMKLPDATRRLWQAGAEEQDAEWWLLVGMTDPVRQNAAPVRHGLTARPIDDATNVLAFDRDYTNPWLVRAMVTLGLRTESKELLTALANRALATTHDATADAGAALCIRAYRYLDSTHEIPEALFAAIDEYCVETAPSPHARRWQISLRYVEALARLRQGDLSRATTALEACATADALDFSPLLATKTVSAAFLRGWMALQARDIEAAGHWWNAGITHAERALHRPWQELMLDRERPALFGLREATAIVDLASQCASGLALLDHARERPGIVAAQLFESLQERLARATRIDTPEPPAPLPVVEVVVEPEVLPEVTPEPEPMPEPPPEPEPPSWRLLDHIDEAALLCGEPNQLGVWDASIDDEFTRNVMLHPPAILEATIPFAEAGRLSAKVALHPEAWGQPGAGGCHFTVTVDSLAEASVMLDPHTYPSHRHWMDISVCVPASDTGTHTLTIETRSVDAPHYGWALFRDVTFFPDPPAAAPPVIAEPAADETAELEPSHDEQEHAVAD